MSRSRLAHCSNCGGDALSGSAVVVWNHKLQEWTPLDEVRDIECSDCGELTSVEWLDEETGDRVYCPECDRQGTVTEMQYRIFDEGQELVERSVCPRCNYRI
ncbi:MAG: hypothetical protein ACK4S4_15650 [Pyrinomonadaceae bacterium]